MLRSVLFTIFILVFLHNHTFFDTFLLDVLLLLIPFSLILLVHFVVYDFFLFIYRTNGNIIIGCHGTRLFVIVVLHPNSIIIIILHASIHGGHCVSGSSIPRIRFHAGRSPTVGGRRPQIQDTIRRCRCRGSISTRCRRRRRRILVHRTPAAVLHGDELSNKSNTGQECAHHEDTTAHDDDNRRPCSGTGRFTFAFAKGIVNSSGVVAHHHDWCCCCCSVSVSLVVVSRGRQTQQQVWFSRTVAHNEILLVD